ncbi:MAG: hypothetical protein HYS13_03855 [Planctomycetia bacterium]|nr:hypothetical protein [Planctomycetia bacterium]
MWRVRTGDGQGYGPIGKKELDEWVAEGRLDANCQVLQDGTKEWRWATELYPQLAQQEQPTTPSAQAAAAQAAVTPGMAGAAGIGVAQATNPYAYTGSSAAANVYGVACLPHRGALSLTLAIVAAACVVITFFGCVFSMVCPPLPLITAVAGIGFGIPPWLISMSDLSGMRVGRRETSGRGMVLTAYIMGLAAAIVSFILLIPAILALFGVVLCCMPFPFAGAQAQ